MKYYTVAEIDIVDRSWIRDYVKHVTSLVEQYGGRYLARTSNFDKTEGERERPHIYLLIEWPSREASKEFYESDAYRPYLQARKAGARTESVLVAGEDVNGVAHVPE